MMTWSPWLHDAEQGQVVTLRAATGKDHLGRTTVQQLCNLLASLFNRGACLLSLLMNGRGIPELLEEVWTHGVEHLRKKWGGCVIVQIHPSHAVLYSSCFIGFRDGRKAIRRKLADAFPLNGVIERIPSSVAPIRRR